MKPMVKRKTVTKYEDFNKSKVFQFVLYVQLPNTTNCPLPKTNPQNKPKPIKNKDSDLIYLGKVPQ